MQINKYKENSEPAVSAYKLAAVTYTHRAISYRQ